MPRLVAAAREREARMYPGAEFNLAKLIVGAEGTLGTVTEALVHLLPLPKVRVRRGAALRVDGGGRGVGRHDSCRANPRRPSCSTA